MFRCVSTRVAAAAVAAVAAPLLMTPFAPMPWATVRADAAAGAVDAAGKVSLSPAPALDANAWKAFKLIAATPLSHDTKRYVFELPGEDAELGLTVASFLLVKADIAGKAVIRPYTPTSSVHQRGTFELIVKSYPNGNVSKHLHELSEGALVEMKGPIKKFDYVPNQWAAVGMIAGGSGITPMFQVIQEMLRNPRDRTEIRLIYANKTPGDILIKEQLDALAVTHPNFKVLYTVDEPAPAGWTGAVGHVTADMIKAFLPPPQKEAGEFKILVCGPPGMMKHVSGEKKSPSDQGELTGLLGSLKYTPDTVFKF